MVRRYVFIHLHSFIGNHANITFIEMDHERYLVSTYIAFKAELEDLISQTNSSRCDYFTTAVRTGGPGSDGVSVLLIERSMGGVSTRRMDCQGVHSSGTTYVTFEDVKVPVENLIGKENKGFRVLMTNFNHERIGIIIQAVRFARVCYEESVKYSNKREVSGFVLRRDGCRSANLDIYRHLERSYMNTPLSA